MGRARTFVVMVALLALAGCGLGNPWPTPPPPPVAPLQVTIFGDSLAYGTGPSLHDALTFDRQPNTVTDRSVIGMGLLDVGARAYVDDGLPASGVVVFAFLGMCWGCAYAWGSPEYYAAWEGAMRQVIGDARDRGLQVVWAKTPPIANPFIGGVAYNVSLVTDRVTAELGVVRADWWTALADVGGAYQQDLYYDTFLHSGAVYRVRDFDGLHLLEAGRRRVAAWTAAALIDAATP